MTKRTDEELLLAIAEEIMGWHPDTGVESRCQVPAYTIRDSGALRIRFSYFSTLVILDNWNPLISLNNLGDALGKLDYTPKDVIRGLGIRIPSRKVP